MKQSYQRQFVIWVICTLAGVIPALPGRCCAAGPLGFDSVRELRREGKKPAEITAIIEAEGLAFELDPSLQRKLRVMGFDDDMLSRIGRVGETGASGRRGESEGPSNENPEQAAKRAETKAADFLQFIGNVHRASGIQFLSKQTTNFTVSGDPASLQRYGPLIVKAESFIKRTFPDPLRVGPDRRRTHIVMLKSTADYERWLTAYFATRYGEKAANEKAELEFALRSSVYYPLGVTVMDLDRAEDVKNWVAFTVGYMFVDVLTDRRVPAALRTGFANYTETALMGKPSRLLTTKYFDFDTTESGNRWAKIVALLFEKHDVGTVRSVLQYSLDDMEEQHFAEAWSLVSLLATAPEKFSQVITHLQNDREALAAVEDGYGLDEIDVQNRWLVFASMHARQD